MKELNESLTKLKKEEKSDCGEEALANVNALAIWIPVSPVEEDHEQWLCSPIDFVERCRATEAGGN
jgi:hypothetical protein